MTYSASLGGEWVDLESAGSIEAARYDLSFRMRKPGDRRVSSKIQGERTWWFKALQKESLSENGSSER